MTCLIEILLFNMEKEILYLSAMRSRKVKSSEIGVCSFLFSNDLWAGFVNTAHFNTKPNFSMTLKFYGSIKLHFNYSFKKNGWDFAFSNDGMFSRNSKILVAPLLAEEGDPSTSYLSLRLYASEYLFDTVRGISSVQKGNSNIITYSVIGRKPA